MDTATATVMARPQEMAAATATDTLTAPDAAPESEVVTAEGKTATAMASVLEMGAASSEVKAMEMVKAMEQVMDTRSTDKRKTRHAPVEERLRARLVLAPFGCLEWTGARDHDGYGRINSAGLRLRTHRVAWAHENGPIPSGMLVLHRCDNPPCCNPDHLFIGTNADNTADMMDKCRWRSCGGWCGGPSKSTTP